MWTINLINIQKVVKGFPRYFCGWAKNEVIKIQHDLQTAFWGEKKDYIIEVISPNGEISYVVFRGARSFRDPTAHYLFEEDQGIIVFNANGNIFRFNLSCHESMDVHCYASVGFNNIDDDTHSDSLFEHINEPNSIDSIDDCFVFLKSAVSPNKKIMVVIDNEGVAAITWNKVLWKKFFPWTYAGYAEIQVITNHIVTINIDSPSNAKQKTLKLYTGAGPGNLNE